MSRRHWQSNGDNYSDNEHELLHQRVLLVQKRVVVVGTLEYVRAQTRGNTTLGVVWGPGLWKTQPIWELRQKPFTISPAPANMADGKYHHSILDLIEVAA